MIARVINLERAPERWAHMQREFSATSFRVERVEAVDGRGLALPDPRFNDAAYRRLHGRHTNVYEVACYFSHLKAIKRLVASGEEHGLICEDDLTFSDDVDTVVREALRYRTYWDILRLTGLSRGRPMKVASLTRKYALNTCLSRLKGAGAYLLSRHAAARLHSALLPMFLPFDHAIDREWVHGLQALYVTPFLVSQKEAAFESSIQCANNNRVKGPQRLLTTYPHQVINELSRYVHRVSRGLHLKRMLEKPAGPLPAHRHDSSL